MCNRRLGLLLALLTLAGCDGGRTSPRPDGAIPTSDGAVPTSDGGPGAVPAGAPLRFDATDAAWPVPARSGGGYDTSNGAGWATVDLDGDGAPELVSTADATGGVHGGGSAPHWEVYRNEGAGFAAAPFLWPVPAAPGLTGGFRATAGRSWALVDLDGDGRPDLVWTGDPASGAVFGNGAAPHWQVYRNEGTGFAAAPFRWSVPAADDLAQGYAATSGRTYALVDLDGDHLPDLVITAAAATGDVLGNGSSPRWSVHRNLGDRFASDPAAWPVPAASSLDRGFFAVGDVGWALLDFDGDERVDLVWTRDPARGEVFGRGASAHWKVFRNGGNGFDPNAANVAVPDPASVTQGFDRVTADGWALLDLDADQRPDLVWTRDPDTGAVHGFGASPYWQVFLNRGDHLEATPARLAVPAPAELPRGFDAVGSDSWSTLDLDGRGAPELVWTRPAAGHPVFGVDASPHWRVFLAAWR